MILGNVAKHACNTTHYGLSVCEGQCPAKDLKRMKDNDPKMDMPRSLC